MKETLKHSSQPLVILISGSRGLARDLISLFYERGHSVSVLSRDRNQIADLRSQLPKLHLFEGDITEPSTAAGWIAAAKKAFGRVDCLVNNAAIQGPGGLFHELPFDEVEHTIDTDLVAPLRLIHHFLPEVQATGGVIVNLSGGGATAARPRFIPYAVSKCALVRATETLAQEYPSVHCYAIAPGTMKTQMTESILDLGSDKAGAEFEMLKKKLDAGGDGTEKAGELILWLAENRPTPLSGKLISAIWDDYRSVGDTLSADLWTLRRVDNALKERIAPNLRNPRNEK